MSLVENRCRDGTIQRGNRNIGHFGLMDRVINHSLPGIQNSLSQTDPNNAVKYTNNWFEYMGKALALDPSNSLLAYRLGVSYCERNECDKAQPILEKLGPLPYLRDEDNVTLMRCKKKCNAN